MFGTCLLIPLVNSVIEDLAVSIRDGVARDDAEESSLVDLREGDCSWKLSVGSSLETLALESFLESSSSVGGV